MPSPPRQHRTTRRASPRGGKLRGSSTRAMSWPCCLSQPFVRYPEADPYRFGSAGCRPACYPPLAAQHCPSRKVFLCPGSHHFGLSDPPNRLRQDRMACHPSLRYFRRRRPICSTEPSFPFLHTLCPMHTWLFVWGRRGRCGASGRCSGRRSSYSPSRDVHLEHLVAHEDARILLQLHLASHAYGNSVAAPRVHQNEVGVFGSNLRVQSTHRRVV